MGREKMGLQDNRAELDFYATNPEDVKEIMTIAGLPKNISILEPCAGNGHIANTLREMGYNNIFTNDIIEREFKLNSVKDFLNEEICCNSFDLCIMNPPFKYAKEFIGKALEYADAVLVIARLDLLESKSRKELNNKHLVRVFVHSNRARFARNGDDSLFNKGTSMSTAWYLYANNKINDTSLIVI